MSRYVEVRCEQGTPEWFTARAGHITGSRADDVLAVLKNGKPAAAREDYKAQLVVERLTGRPQESGYTNAAMERGKELEPLARAAYEAQTGNLVTESGFLQMVGQSVGCSLDGFVTGEDAIVEIKCPGAKNHLKWLKAKAVPAEYLPQVLHNLYVTGASRCEWVSYHPDFPESLRLLVVRVDRDEAQIAAYAEAVEKLLAEVTEELEGLAAWV